MKKVICIFFTAIIFCSIFVGCSNESNKRTENETSVTEKREAFGGDVLKAAKERIIKDLCRTYNTKEQYITIATEHVEKYMDGNWHVQLKGNYYAFDEYGKLIDNRNFSVKVRYDPYGEYLSTDW